MEMYILRKALECVNDDMEIWHVAPYELPMKLSIYNYHWLSSTQPFGNVLMWFPEDYQWWITGFNYSMSEPNHSIMYMIVEIDFSDSTSMQESNGDMSDMYYDFKYYVEKSLSEDDVFVVFDDSNKHAYVIWGN